MLKLCSSTVVILSRDQIASKKIYTVATRHDIRARIVEASSDARSSRLVVADFSYLKEVKDIKDRVVVIKPPIEHLKDMLDAGYTRFLFDPDNEAEVLVALCEEHDGQAVRGFVECGPCLINFKTREVEYNGEYVYMTKGDLKYMKERFIDKKDCSSTSHRTALFRMRNRLGKEFLA